jgi:hypothetical protein
MLGCTAVVRLPASGAARIALLNAWPRIHSHFSKFGRVGINLAEHQPDLVWLLHNKN